jgi:hypothetical protein
MLALVILAALALVLALAWLCWLIRKHGPGLVLWRFVSGHHLDGVHRTDAGWLARPTRVLHPTGRASWWAHQPRLHRAGYRWAVLGLSAGLAATWRMLSGGLALAVTAAAVAALAALGGWRAGRWVTSWRHRKRVERPMSAALAPFLGTAPRTVQAALKVRRGFADARGGEHVAALYLPDHYAATPEQKARVLDVAHARLGIALKPQWQTDKHPARVNFLRAPTPPERVLMADELAALDGRPDHKVLLGRDEAGELASWDTSLEDPHVAIHGGSRRGKTSLLLAVSAQELSRGGGVTAIDPKRIGLLPLVDVPGFRLLYDPRNVPAMWEAVAGFRGLVESRYDQLAEDPTAEFPRELLLLDEVSMLSGLWAAWWQQVKGSGDPRVPPVWGDIAAAVWLGAQAHCHVIVAGQRLDYQILGGMLGSFGVRMLAGFAPVDYNRLIGIPPVLRSHKQRGRFLYYAGDEPAWVQLVYARPEDWRDYALDRIKARDLARSAEGATRDVIGLAAAAGHVGLSVDAFRKRLQRQGRPAGEYRVGNQPAWPAASLEAWAGPPPAAARGAVVIPGTVVTD